MYMREYPYSSRWSGETRALLSLFMVHLERNEDVASLVNGFIDD